MKENEILDEIHRLRELHARECGFDIDTMFARMRDGLERTKAEGREIVSLDPRPTEETDGLVREDPPPA